MVALLALAPVTGAQKPAARAVPPVPGSELSVTLITVGLGSEVFERFGHNALMIQDSVRHTYLAYHWGLFSFDEPGFLARFLTGDTKYWMGASDPRTLIEGERNRGRPVSLQQLNLTPAQALALKNIVETNALDQNKFYRYDYFRDNCSTRLRDALDKALGGAIRQQTEGIQTEMTYRRESIRLTDGDRPAQAGIDIALGRPADVPINAWQSFFIPMRLRNALRGVHVKGAAGVDVPLVGKEFLVSPPAAVATIPELAVSPRIAPAYMVVGVLLALLVLGLRIMMQDRRGAAVALAIIGATWSLLCGVLGVILLLAWMATKHAFWAYNENVLLLTPLSLALVVLIPLSVLTGKAARPARMVGAIIAVMGLVSLCLAVLPGGQESRAVVALLLPTQLAIAWALGLPSRKVVPA